MEWISVEDRMPELHDEYYLICIDNRIIRIGMYYDGVWSCCSGIYMTDMLRPCYSVTHWTTLPKLPND